MTAVTVDSGQQNGSRAGTGRTCEKVGGGAVGGQGADEGEVCKKGRMAKRAEISLCYFPASLTLFFTKERAQGFPGRPSCGSDQEEME